MFTILLIFILLEAYSGLKICLELVKLRKSRYAGSKRMLISNMESMSRSRLGPLFWFSWKIKPVLQWAITMALLGIGVLHVLAAWQTVLTPIGYIIAGSYLAQGLADHVHNLEWGKEIQVPETYKWFIRIRGVFLLAYCVLWIGLAVLN